MPDTALYCPSIDKEMQEQIAKLVANKWVDLRNVYSPGVSLESLNDKWKLYVLCHGDPNFPVFRTDSTWTAKQLADLMVKGGLKNTHRDIELLVCNSGASLSTEAVLAERVEANDYYKSQIEKLPTQKEKDDLVKGAVKVLESMGPKPSFYVQKDQLLPLCAQFVDELKKLDFSDLRVTSYAAKVAQKWDIGAGKISLDTSKLEGEDPSYYIFGALDYHKAGDFDKERKYLQKAKEILMKSGGKRGNMFASEIACDENTLKKYTVQWL